MTDQTDDESDIESVESGEEDALQECRQFVVDSIADVIQSYSTEVQRLDAAIKEVRGDLILVNTQLTEVNSKIDELTKTVNENNTKVGIDYTRLQNVLEKKEDRIRQLEQQIITVEHFIGNEYKGAIESKIKNQVSSMIQTFAENGLTGLGLTSGHMLSASVYDMGSDGQGTYVDNSSSTSAPMQTENKQNIDSPSSSSENYNNTMHTVAGDNDYNSTASITADNQHVVTKKTKKTPKEENVADGSEENRTSVTEWAEVDQELRALLLPFAKNQSMAKTCKLNVVQRAFVKYFCTKHYDSKRKVESLKSMIEEGIKHGIFRKDQMIGDVSLKQYLQTRIKYEMKYKSKSKVSMKDMLKNRLKQGKTV